MPIWGICWLSLTLSACVSSPVEIPSWDLEPATIEAEKPLPLPAFPAGTRHADNITFNVEEFRQIVEYLTVAGGNYDIALANAEALEAQAAAYNHLIEAGKLHARFSQIREEQLAQERQDHLMDNWFHRALIALGVAAAL